MRIIVSKIAIEWKSSFIECHLFFFQADAFINTERIKIYALLAGAMVWDISRDTANVPRDELQSLTRHVVNVCEGLDWKRVLAVHLW